MGMNYDLFKDYFDSVVPRDLSKKLNESKNRRKTMSQYKKCRTDGVN